MKPEAVAEAAALWGAECNDCGVLTDVTERVDIAHGGFVAEVRLYRTGKGYCLVALWLGQPDSGFAIPTSVWSRSGFADLDEARGWALDYLIDSLNGRNATPSREAAKRTFIQLLEEARTPQLSLF